MLRSVQPHGVIMQITSRPFPESLAKSLSTPRGFFTNPGRSYTKQMSVLASPVLSILGSVDYQFFGHFLCAEALSRHLGLNNEGMVFQNESHARRARAGKERRPPQEARLPDA